MKVLLTGGNGMLGKSILRLAPQLSPEWDISAPTRSQLNLIDSRQVEDYLAENKFDLVVHAAAKVGGIKANIADPTGFLVENMLINTNVIDGARRAGIEKLIYLGSSCMYPKDYRNPLVENDILAEKLEPTNEGYALSKIAGERLCNYISQQYGYTYRTFIPCNLYGPGDHFDLQKGHLIAAVILKVFNAVKNNEKSVEIWGDGEARREFMYVDDLSSFILTCVDRLKDMPARLNTGLGVDYSVNDYYKSVAQVIGYTGEFTHKMDAPTGMHQKLMDSSLAKNYGWKPSTTLSEGLQKTYNYFLEENGIQK